MTLDEDQQDHVEGDGSPDKGPGTSANPDDSLEQSPNPKYNYAQEKERRRKHYTGVNKHLRDVSKE